MRYFVDLGTRTVELRVERNPDGTFRVHGPDGRESTAKPSATGPGLLRVLVGDQSVEVQLGEGEVRLDERRFSVGVLSEREQATAPALNGSASSVKRILAPMPGRIVRVLCVPGEAVKKGSPLVVIEAMKMQNELCAGADEVVTAVRVSSGDAVDRGALLLEFA